MITTDLSHFALIEFSGADAPAFLQGQLSCDVMALAPGQAQYGSYSTPKGRMLASFLLWREERACYMQLPLSQREAVRKRLSMYILRAKVQARDADDRVLIGCAGDGVDAALRALFPEIPQQALHLARDGDAALLRLDADRFEIIASSARAATLTAALRPLPTVAAPQAAWDLLDIRAGVPYVLPETREQFVPQTANLDLIGGISFSKGCYPGQEIVARMHYLGRLKQRMYLAHIENAGPVAPHAGDALYSGAYGEQASGTVVNAAPAPGGGYDLLAIAHIDSAAHNDVRWKSPEGPALQFKPLPYDIPPAAKS